jgi:hypothetical protein
MSDQIEAHQPAHFRAIGFDQVAHHVLVHHGAVIAREERAARGHQEQRTRGNAQADACWHERKQQGLQAHDHDEQGSQEQRSTRGRMPHRSD